MFIYSKMDVGDSSVLASDKQSNIEYFDFKSSISNNDSKLQSSKNVEKKLKLPILMYHHIDTIDKLPKTDKIGISLRVSPRVFEKQLQFLQKNNYNTINSFQLQDYLNGRFELPTNPIMITFDDGYADNYNSAFPLLKKYNMVADFGIITSVVGYGEYMSWDQLREMKATGMSFASHTVHHCTIAIKNKKGIFEDSPTSPEEKPCSKFGAQEKLSVGQIKYEFERSKKLLEENLDIKISHLIYPLGNYNKQAQEIAKNIGYSFATTVEPQKDNITDFNSPFKIGRIRVVGQQTGDLNGFFVK